MALNTLVALPMGDAADFVTLAAASGLEPGALYVQEDARRIALALTTSTYRVFIPIHVGTSAPGSPVLNDLWVDTN